MASDGQIVFEVTADGKHAIADIKDITRAIKTEAGKWDDAAKESTNNIGNSFSGMLKTIAAGFSAAKIGKALLDLGKEAVQAASDLREVQNVVDTTFGEAGAAKIEAWAKKAGTQFGLTETQAKRFTSTLGAMMKSSGMAGDEIVTMSTDLAGLAADMSSYYNLDFDTAFQKIRSGISGETEPLKQLGINMSVANLEAFALQQGLQKTFSQMSQGEQTMLRYQYLMQATADAQGDFAKTSDGYANGMRSLETEIASLKTNLGENLLPAVQWAVGELNSLFGSDEETAWSKRRTVLDDIMDIDAKTQEAIEKINSTQRYVNELSSALVEIGGKKETLEAATGNVTTAAEGISKLATELSKVKIEGDAKTAFESTLTVLKNNVDSLAAISGDDAYGIEEFLSGISEKAKTLSPTDVDAWEDLLNEVTTSIPGLSEAQTAARGVQKLADELSGVTIAGNTQETFQQTLTALYNNIDALSAIKAEDAQGVKDWLDGVATEAAKLSPEDAQAWQTLLGSLVQEIPGVEGEDGTTLMERLASYYLSLGSESEEGAKGLAALGFTTSEVEEKQKDWLATCRELVRTMPGLSEIINTQTGEVKGGIPAIKAYADEWARAAKYEAQVQGIKEKKSLYEGLPEQSNLAAEVRQKRAVAKAQLIAYGKMSDEQAEAVLAGAEYMEALAYGKPETGYTPGEKLDTYGYVDYERLIGNPQDAYGFFIGGAPFGTNEKGEVTNGLGGWEGDASKTDNALQEYMKALYDYDEFVEVQPEMEAAYQEALEQTAEAFGMTTDAVEKDAKAMQDAEKNMTKVEKAAQGDAAAMEDVQKAVNGANEALKNMADYAQGVHDAVVQAINGTVSSLNDVDYKSYGKQIEKISELTAKQAQYKVGSDEWKKLQTEIDNANKNLVSTESIMSNLDSQAAFLDDYLANLRKAREMGLSNELLAELSDGSVESAEYLSALVNDNTGAAQKIDEKYKEIQGKKAALAEELAGQQLKVDETYANLAAKAKEAINALDLAGEASTNSGKTVEAIASGISSHIPEVKEAVDGILAELNRLNGYGINIDFGGFGSISFTTSTGQNAEGSGRFGLDFIPHDDYIARLHEGERVLTAQENQIWNGLRNGGIAGFSLDDLGGVMRDNVKAGGNVYLDGRVVGSVISDQQGKSYRQLQRSGWQS